MSIRCNKCENKIFDSNAYLKISEIEQRQQEKVSLLTNKIKNLKDTDEKLQESIKLTSEKWYYKQYKNVKMLYI